MAPLRIRIRRPNQSTKARKWNWDTKETLSLLDVYVSERKQCPKGANKWKQSLWKRVTNKLYPSDSPFRRTHVEVQKKWRNLCSALRQELNKNVRRRSGKEHLLPPILTKVAEIVADEHAWKRELVESPIPDPMPSKKRAINGEVAMDTTSSSSSSMPSSSSLNAGSAIETILPTLPSSSTITTTAKKTPVSSANTSAPVVFIKQEPLSPVPEPTAPPHTQKETEDVSKTKAVSIAKSSHPVFTFATPSSTNSTSGPTPLRIISIVNPLSSPNSQSSTSNTPPKFVLKPLNSFTNLAKPSTSNMVVLGPRGPVPHKKLTTQQPVFLQARKPDEVKIVDSDVLKMEAEKLVVAQERLQIEKEALQVQKEKLDVEKKKLEHAKHLFENEKTCKRTILEEKKIFLENKKLKSEIGKLELEKELLALQVKQLKD